MIILGIDTSCDDTSVATLKVKNQKSKIKKIKVLSNVISSQEKLHSQYGGVYPALAAREHQANLIPVLEKALKEAGVLVSSRLKGDKISNFQFPISKQIQKSKLKTITKILEREPALLKNLLNFLNKYQKPKIEAIAVTTGPGLEPCLWQGLNFAKALSFAWNLPIIPVNHLEGHLLSVFLEKTGKDFQFSIFNFQRQFCPALGLIVSGGHTQLVFIKKIGDYKVIGETLDDACGECFDKTARILGLGYPGGPAISRQAEKWQLKVQSSKFKVVLPRPMINSKNFDFSFSGLKTAVLYGWQKIPKKQQTEETKTLLAQEIQQAVIDVLLKKTLKAVKEYKVKNIILSGGVSANQELRQQFKKSIDVFNHQLHTSGYQLNLFCPQSGFTTDNASMIALAGFFNLKKKIKAPFKSLKANGNLQFH